MDPTPNRNQIREQRIPPQRKIRVGKQTGEKKVKLTSAKQSLPWLLRSWPQSSPPTTTTTTTTTTTLTVLWPVGFAAGKKKESTPTNKEINRNLELSLFDQISTKFFHDTCNALRRHFLCKLAKCGRAMFLPFRLANWHRPPFLLFPPIGFPRRHFPFGRWKGGRENVIKCTVGLGGRYRDDPVQQIVWKNPVWISILTVPGSHYAKPVKPFASRAICPQIKATSENLYYISLCSKQN